MGGPFQNGRVDFDGGIVCNKYWRQQSECEFSQLLFNPDLKSKEGAVKKAGRKNQSIWNEKN